MKYKVVFVGEGSPKLQYPKGNSDIEEMVPMFW
jgi:hypothetical protein